MKTRKTFVYALLFSLCLPVLSQTPMGVQFVDLGLPSGTLWANMNVGAESVHDYGGFYCWAETEEKAVYSEDTYKYRSSWTVNDSSYVDDDGFTIVINGGTYWGYTKYVYSEEEAFKGQCDYKETLEEDDDAAFVNWGENWKIPSSSQLSELRNYCTWTWVSLNGINGYKVDGINGNYIFLPAAGFRENNSYYEGDLFDQGTRGLYLTSDLSSRRIDDYASCLYFDSREITFSYKLLNGHFHGYRCYGQSIRPVYAGLFNLTYMIGDYVYQTFQLKHKAEIPRVTSPTREGYTFLGWNEIPETMPSHDVIVSGTFMINKYKLNYLVDNQIYKSYDVEYGTAIIPEPFPEKEGYTFSGWSDIPETMPSHNVTIRGAFTKNIDEQTLVLTEIPEMTYGDEAYILPQTTTEGLTLTWNVDDGQVANVNENILTIIGAGTTTVTATQEGNENYKPFTKEYTLSVDKAALTITANDCTKQQGEDIPELTVSYSGFKNGDDASVLTTQPTITTTATTSSPAGTYPITVNGAEAANYDITYINGTLTVIAVVVTTDHLYANNLTLHPGEKQTVVLQLDNETTLIACEFYLQLPNGFSIEEDEEGYLVADVVSDRSNRHTFEATDEGNGLYHFLCYSTRNNAFKGNSGDFITLSLMADENVEDGIYSAELKNIIFSDEDKQQINLKNTAFGITVISYTLGDINDDGKINVMDIVEIVGFIMSNPSDNFVFAAADIDENGTVNVMDLVNLVEMIMTIASQAPVTTTFAQDDMAAFSCVELGKADETTITLSVPDDRNHIAAQFYVSLSGNAKLKDVVSDKTHQSEFTRLDDGRYMVMVYSGSNASFSNDCPIKLQVSGDCNAIIEDVVFIDADKKPVAFDSATLGNTQGIMSIGTGFNEPTNIYSVSGKLIKKDATSTLGLAKGVYVINNEKVIVK